MRGARVALGVGFALVAVALAIVLSGSPQVLTGTNGIEPQGNVLATVPGGGSACQAGETLPEGSSAIRISLGATAGPRVAAAVRAGGRIVTHGVSAPGWLADVVTIPVAPLKHTVRDATVCFGFVGADERISFFGLPTPPQSAARSGAGVLPGRVAVEYIHAGHSSWWSLARSVARRMGLGRAWAGVWVALFVGALMAAAILAASLSLIRESR
ncbi:MAG TPA: hypothetical protein VGI76_11335 [Solirubrobacteraceae bacterium]